MTGEGKRQIKTLSKDSKFRMAMAMRHADKPGAGAASRRAHLHSGSEKKEVVRREWQRGTLHMGGSGKVVPKNRPDIMWAIANSEARRHARNG